MLVRQPYPGGRRGGGQKEAGVEKTHDRASRKGFLKKGGEGGHHLRGRSAGENMKVL